MQEENDMIRLWLQYDVAAVAGNFVCQVGSMNIRMERFEEGGWGI